MARPRATRRALGRRDTAPEVVVRDADRPGRGPAGASTADDSRTVVRPPMRLLLAAAASVLACAALLLPASMIANVLGYLLGTLMTTSLVAAFRVVDQRRRLDARYSPRRRVGAIASLLLVAGLAAAFLHVWAIATEIAK
jgi:hypothetical protein